MSDTEKRIQLEDTVLYVDIEGWGIQSVRERVDILRSEQVPLRLDARSGVTYAHTRHYRVPLHWLWRLWHEAE